MVLLSLASTASSAMAYCFAAGMPTSNSVEVTVVHPYGVAKFPEAGIIYVDTPSEERGMLERWGVLFPNQLLPEHKHTEREDRFTVLRGHFFATMELQTHRVDSFGKLTVPAGSMHAVQAGNAGCIFTKRIPLSLRSDVHWAARPDARLEMSTTFTATDGSFLPILGCMVSAPSKF